MELDTLPLQIENKGVNGQLKLELSSHYELHEDKYLLSVLTDIVFLSEDELVFLQEDQNSVIRFGSRGDVSELIARSGRGPFEASGPDITFIDEDGRIFVWDSNLLKLLAFSQEGEPLFECNEFRWAVKDLAVVDKFFIFYNSGNPDGPIIDIFQTDSEGCPGSRVTGFGSQTEAHKFLTSIVGSVGLAIDENDLYYMSPSRLEIRRVNLEDFKETSQDFEDSDFYVPEIKSRADILRRGNMNSILYETSHVKNIIPVEDFIIVELIVGKNLYNEQFNMHTSENRKTKLIFFDKKFNYLDEFSYSIVHNRRIQDGRWFKYPGGVAYISRQPIDGEPLSPREDHPFTVHLFEIEKVQ